MKMRIWLVGFLTISMAAHGLSVAAPVIKVTLLGTGSPLPVLERFGPSILIEAGKETLLFDCGRGASQRLHMLNAPVASLDKLFLTHLHSDHISGISDLFLTGWLMGRSAPLNVWGPIGSKSMMNHLVKAFSFDIKVRREFVGHGAGVVAHEISEGVVYRSNGVSVKAFLVNHGTVKPAYGYRIDFAGRSVVLSGDTTYSDNLIKYAKGADLLVHEIIDVKSFAPPFFSKKQRQEVIQHHTTPEQASKVFSRVKPKLAVFSHVVPPIAQNAVSDTKANYSGRVEMGEDLMTIEVGDEVKVIRH